MANDKAEDFRIALQSITTKQTVKPSEVVLVIDGPVSDGINRVISDAETANSGLFKVIRFEQNQGLGIALRKGMETASNEIVMRMDSDDVAVPDRFEKQLRFMEEHPNVAVCGGQIAEFIDRVDNVVGRRIVPENDQDIKVYMRSRCPMNLVTVMFKKEDVIAVGGYQDWYWEEDYYLWIRLALGGYSFYNIQENLVNVRVGEEMYARRGGVKYFKSEKRLQKYMLDNHVISFPQYIINVLKRLIVQVLLPNRIRGWVYRTFARN